MLKADFHIHTYRSRDSINTPKVLINRCLKAGLNCIAVTDHNSIAGALEVKALAPFKVIVGEEIKTSEGEIIGLFLTEEVPGGLRPEETIELVKGQGGLVCVPHPFDWLRGSTISADALMRIARHIDLVEAFNSRTTLLRHSQQAGAFGRSLGLPLGAGTDAHTPWEIGCAYVEMPEFHGAEDFLEAVRHGKVRGKRAFFLVHGVSTAAKWVRKLHRWLPS